MSDLIEEVAHDEWSTTPLPQHLLTGLDWARYSDGSIIWSWRCHCRTKGSARNEHIAAAIWAHLHDPA